LETRSRWRAGLRRPNGVGRRIAAKSQVDGFARLVNGKQTPQPPIITQTFLLSSRAIFRLFARGNGRIIDYCQVKLSKIAFPGDHSDDPIFRLSFDLVGFLVAPGRRRLKPSGPVWAMARRLRLSALLLLSAADGDSGSPTCSRDESDHADGRWPTGLCSGNAGDQPRPDNPGDNTPAKWGIRTAKCCNGWFLERGAAQLVGLWQFPALQPLRSRSL